MTVMAEPGLQRTDTTRGPPLRILSLDGGGVRGYSMLVLLQELMYKMYSEVEGRAPRRDEIPKPCDHFDLIAGTGTGGLIAIMLGRLRLDLETCKAVYIRMTRKVFETDKTLFGMPYRSSLFKASKLEEAIRECVREHTLDPAEGNDGTAAGGRAPGPPGSSDGAARPPPTLPRRHSVASSIGSSAGRRSAESAAFLTSLQWGNGNASLYDAREHRCKTAVTAVYKDTDPQTGGPILLRSYDSRTEPPVEFDCTIWQAGRATCAIGRAFKPIRIGTSTFADEGAGRYNPAPQVLDEALLNEWPGRELGVFVSVGTGKRPPAAAAAAAGGGGGAQGKDWWEGFLGGNLGEFADFRRTLIAKIEACEAIHQQMRTEHLPRRGAHPDCYYRLNVEMGVGEFGMNEWARVADISTSTRMFLARPDSKALVEHAAAKLARIERAARRAASSRASHHHHHPAPLPPHAHLDGQLHPALRPAPPSPPNPLAAELPGDEGRHFHGSARAPPRPAAHRASPDDKFAVLSPHDLPLAARRSNESRRVDDAASSNGSFLPSPLGPSPRRSREDVDLHHQELPAAGPPPLPPQIPHSPSFPAHASHSPPLPPLPHQQQQQHYPQYFGPVEAPPRPPKSPIQLSSTPVATNQPTTTSALSSPYQVSPISPQEMMQRHSIPSSIASSLVSPQRYSGVVLPYPEDDGPPPVNMAAKPHIQR